MWRDKFVERGGFSHLLHTFISLDIKSIETNLSLKCIEQLILMLWSFIQSFKDQSKIVLELKENVVLKSIALIDMITEYSIITEKNRGESYEELSKRIIINNMKKKKYKSYMAGNKGAGSSNDKKPI